ncbi:23S rRNA (pseudouridine(1915)-N(3))-methyltransferase RlmH [Oceanicaulis alexandrii]|uniref:23S rRNA (pseudouridine(1915)-N(3))-methyltransferase RlmH n=1 Tax=Oceanicaulis alexandrii TaxID=153233 RepID=UPI0023544FE2|nr:23S rRNA (pseudouridine(1915)-N(3))-methyltransferase RlmH [Oceanicaulis alexandrii]
MRVEIRAIGRIKAGPERELMDQYLDRANGVGRSVSLGPVCERELDPRTLKDKAAETQALIADMPASALIFALDETGKPMSSLDFARVVETARDDGARDLVFLIGGADGHDRSALPHGARMLSFGKATWPHKLVRVMLAEQIYRAASVLAGAPYHREG